MESFTMSKLSQEDEGEELIDFGHEASEETLIVTDSVPLLDTVPKRGTMNCDGDEENVMSGILDNRREKSPGDHSRQHISIPGEGISHDVILSDNNNGNSINAVGKLSPNRDGTDYTTGCNERSKNIETMDLEKPLIEPLSDSISQLVTGSINQSVSEQISLCVTEQISLCVTEQISQVIDDPIKETVISNERSDMKTSTVTAATVPVLSFAELVKEDLSTLDEVTRESSSASSDLPSDSIHSNIHALGQGYGDQVSRFPTDEEHKGSRTNTDLPPTIQDNGDPTIQDNGDPTIQRDGDPDGSNHVSSIQSTISHLLSSKLVIAGMGFASIFSMSHSLLFQAASFFFGIIFGLLILLPLAFYFGYKHFIVWQGEECLEDSDQTDLNVSNTQTVKMSQSPSFLSSELIHGQKNQFKTYSGWILLRSSDADTLLGLNKDSKSGHSSNAQKTTTNSSSLGTSSGTSSGTKSTGENSGTRQANVLSVKKKTVHLRIDPPSFIRIASHKKFPTPKDDPKKVLMMSTSKPEAVKIIDLNKYPDRTLRIFKRSKVQNPGHGQNLDVDMETSEEKVPGPPKLKHVWSKRLPIVITLKVPDGQSKSGQPCDTITLVIWARDCKDKEVLFWTLFPLFPIGLAFQEKMASQKTYLESKETKSMSKSVSRPADLSSIGFNNRMDSSSNRRSTQSGEYWNRRSAQSGEYWNQRSTQSGEYWNQRSTQSGEYWGSSNIEIDWPVSVCSTGQEWVNVFLDHCMRDFVGHIKWRKWLHRKMERKLQRIKLPNFMDPLKVRGVTLGSVPKLSDGQFLSRDADGQVFLSFNLEAGFDPIYNLIDGDDDLDIGTDVLESGVGGKSGLEGSSTSSSGMRKKGVFEMSLETKLNPKYFTQHQMLQLSSPSKDLSKGASSADSADAESINESSESDTEDEDDEPTFESISSNEEEEGDEDLLDKSDLDDWKLDTETTSVSTESGLELGSFVSPGSSPGQSHPLQSLSQIPSNLTTGKSLMDRWTDKLKMKSRQILANNPTVRKYFDTVTSSKVGVTVRVNGLKGRLIVCLAAPPSDRVWIKLDDSSNRSPNSSSLLSTPTDGHRRSTFGSPTDSRRSSKGGQIEGTDGTGIKLDLEVIVEMNRKALFIKSNFIRNLLEGRLRKQLIEILTTYDDLSLYPLLLLPSSFYYCTSKNNKSVFCDTF